MVPGPHRRPRQALRRQAADEGDRRHRPGDRRGRVPRPARAQRVRQDHGVALPRGARAAGAGRITFGDSDGVRRGEAGQPLAEQAQHRHGVPVVRAVAAHDGAQEHRLPAQGAQAQAGAAARDGSSRLPRRSTARPLLDRYPAQLSGGQQQRVALARGLVARPELVLFDEPLSNLDARLRDQVRAEIHELHTRLGFTAVFVTHDQSEALALGDRLAIMRHGTHRAVRHARAGATSTRRRSTSPRSSASPTGCCATTPTGAGSPTVKRSHGASARP